MKMVRATLKGTYHYFNAHKGIKEKFGPGENILIPQGLAYSLGLKVQPAEDAKTPEDPTPPTPSESADEIPAESEPVGEAPADDLSVLGLSATVLAALRSAGFTTFTSLAAATDDALVAVKGVGAQTANRIKAVAQEHMH